MLFIPANYKTIDALHEAYILEATSCEAIENVNNDIIDIFGYVDGIPYEAEYSTSYEGDKYAIAGKAIPLE